MQKFIATGRVGGDADIRFFPDGTPVISFSVACSEKYKDKKTGEDKEHTEWLSCEMLGKGKDKLALHITKGRRIFIEAKVATKKWQKDGVDQSKTVFRVQEIEFLSPKESSSARPSQPSGDQQPAEPHKQPAPKPKNGGGGGGNGDGGFNETDNIPFVSSWDMPRHKRFHLR